jgi:hypothetical protein
MRKKNLFLLKYCLIETNNRGYLLEKGLLGFKSRYMQFPFQEVRSSKFYHAYLLPKMS